MNETRYTGFLGTVPVSSTATRMVNFDSSATGGIRIGYWSERESRIGIALDLSYFRLKGPNVQASVLSFSPLVLLRLPLLAGEEFPKGRLQPYLGLGPGFFRSSDLKVDFRPSVPSAIDSANPETKVGLDFRGGLAWYPHRRVAMFAEYRFTRFSLEGEARSCAFICPLAPGSEGKITTSAIETSHFLMGISFPLN